MRTLIVTNIVPPDRVGAYRALHERTPIELALFGGRANHATGHVDDPGVPHRHVASAREIFALTAEFDVVVAGTIGRTQLPAAYAGARRHGKPFVLWSALWAPLTAPALLPSVPLLSHLYRHADAVIAYGEHVSAHVRARGATQVHIAPQAVDNAFWSAPANPEPGEVFRVAFAGRPARAKGLHVLLEAWRASRLESSLAALVLAGVRPEEAAADGGGAMPGVQALGMLAPEDVRNFYAGAGVVVIPSIPTPDFREPWGLVANEAMNQAVPIIATDAVGAAAGGLVRHERNGLVVPAGDPAALAAALARLRTDESLRRRLGVHARVDVQAFSYASFASGFTSALEAAADRRKDYR